MYYVKKRNGNIEEFSKRKIEEALKTIFKKAKRKTPSQDAKTMTEIVMKKLNPQENERIKIEEIQDVIQSTLIENNFQESARLFIIYREERKKIRDWVRSKEKFIDRYKKSTNTANATVDDNSNVGGKNIGILNAEIHKSDNIQVSRGMVMRKLRELYKDFDAKNYVRDLENHIIYKHDESSFAGAVAPYCVSVSMYPFLLNGLKGLGGLSAAPKNLDSYCGMYSNMIFAISAQYAGAVATSEFLLYFDYFARKEWGDDYYTKCDDITRVSNNPKSIRQQIHQYFQQVVYSINQPAGSRGSQSPFTNFSYFDKPFFEGMFGNFMFPDGTSPIWESLSWLQKDFMMWFNEERTRCVLTFPVESFALVYQNGEFLDKESADFVAEEYARGHSFFTYISDTVDSLSSCCFDGDEIIQVKVQDVLKNISIKDFVDSQNDTVDPVGNNTKYDSSIDSYNERAENKGSVNISGVLKKPYTGNMYTFKVGENKITVTSDHPMLVKDKSSNEIKTISAEELYGNEDKFFIAIEK